MVKNIIMYVCVLITFAAVFQGKKDAEYSRYVIAKQRNEIESLKYQFNQCKILYIGM